MRPLAMIALILAASLLLGGSLPQAVDAGDRDDEGWTTDDLERLLAKADPALRAALEADDRGTYEVILTGPRHAGPPVASADRTAARDALDSAAAPFFGWVHDVALRHGAAVVGAWSAAPAIKVAGDIDVLFELAASEAVLHVALDRPDAVRVADDPTPVSARDAPGATNTESRRMLQAEDAWAAGYDGSGVVIGATGTGVDGTHEAFRHANGTSRITAWANCEHGCDPSGTPIDDHGHTTHVTASAAGSNLYDDPDHGVFQEPGIAPGAEIVAAKFLSWNGAGSLQGAMDSLQWVFDQGADISVNGWSTHCDSVAPLVALLDQLKALGMVSVFPLTSGPTAGPACSQTVIATSWVNEAFEGPEADRGPCVDPVTGENHICPDFVTNGIQVRSAVPRGAAYGDPSGYKTLSGDSPTAGLMAGALAVAEQMKRAATGTGWNTADDAERLVHRATALPLPSAAESPNNIYGWGHPRLMNVLAVLENVTEPRIDLEVRASAETLCTHETADLHVSVTNYGVAQTDGRLRVSLVHPGDLEQVLSTQDVRLGFLDGESVTHTFTVETDTAVGPYTLRALYDYTWTNATTNETVHENASGTAGFQVDRAILTHEKEGFDEEALLLVPQMLRFETTNEGNVAANDLRVDFVVPDHYLFLPDPTRDMTRSYAQYADPPPDEVREDPTFGRITLIWKVGDLEPGDTFAFETDLVPTQLGDHRFRLTTRHGECDGQPTHASQLFQQNVVGPV